MEVYHGGYCPIKTPEIITGRYAKDFGTGFDCTELREQFWVLAKFKQIPTHWDIGKVYKRLIVDLCNKQNKRPIETLIEVYNSWLSRKIEDFNSSLYYESPDYLYESYMKGEVI